jgi:hypothetical protein
VGYAEDGRGNEHWTPETDSVVTTVRNYSIVPMQKDVALDQPEALNLDQEAWVQRFPYATILGKIVYVNAITRPDISFAVSTLSRFMAKPTTHAACRGLARLLDYLHNTAKFGLRYHVSELNLYAYTDSDWATCPITRRCITGKLVFIAGAPVAWLSRRQQIVATSSMEAEYTLHSTALSKKLSGSVHC